MHYVKYKGITYVQVNKMKLNNVLYSLNVVSLPRMLL
jgi:hypothetical protein